MDKKIKVLTISDHPLSPSGVGTQTRNVITALLDTGKFKILSLGGAMHHPDYTPTQIEGYGENWIIQPVKDYGTPEMIKSIVRTEKIDMIWFMTDPRFYEWLWAFENEIRPHVPMVYYHVWDNYPYPSFNTKWYAGNDCIATISKVTDDIVKTLVPDVRSEYIPHAVDDKIFAPLTELDRKMFREQAYNVKDDTMIVFWNNRNARRKQSGTLVYWFKEFLDKVGHDKAKLIMHTDPSDPHGQDLYAVLDNLGLHNGEVSISVQKLPPEILAKLYAAADLTVNISDAEGFGLATLESLSCGTPVMVTMTGGLQEQVTDGEGNWFGMGIQPSSKAIIGSQQVPWIYEDRISKEDFLECMTDLYNAGPEGRKKMGEAGRAHILKNYNYLEFKDKWTNLMLETHENFGSWENRSNYQNWRIASL